MSNLFSYTDYRNFLNDYYKEKKEKNPNFSFRVFSRLCGFSSPNYLKLVIMGKRSLASTGFSKLVKGLGLKKMEARFFKHLVDFSQGGNG